MPASPSESPRERSSRYPGEARSRSDDRKRRRDASDSEHEDRYRRDEYRRERSDKYTRDRSKDRSYRRHEERSHRRHKSPDHDRRKQRSKSPDGKRRRRSCSDSKPRSPLRKSRAPLPSQDESFRGKVVPKGPGEQQTEKQKPNFKPTGLLAKEANTVAGTTTVLKYHEPAEARKPPPKEQWRMYVFRKKDMVDTIYLFQRSCWLAGRDEKVTDLTLEHPSISKQHAVIQFRFLTSTNEYGDKLSKVKPYLIDLESANGTKLNGKKVEASRYVELVDGDVVGFGDSEREYVLMLPPP